ncbi:hypothetical protein HID58_075067 [Brassica napus]|uniref:Uncharacterized protein n=1 Tax=Brassica napus TaxID=3708 RepID=A0ABQ7YIM9_BRANA|nr:hypothetical protein HID58_075067 [Brassica napus]
MGKEGSYMEYGRSTSNNKVNQKILLKRLAPRQARVLERAQICNQNTAELFSDDHNDNIYEAEETYEDDGDQIEDFSHDREKDEGYFAADGNFVEYVSIRDKKVKVEIKHWFNALGS